MGEKNARKFCAVAKHIEDVIKSNPSIEAVCLTVDMRDYPTRAFVTYSDGLETRTHEIEVR